MHNKIREFSIEKLEDDVQRASNSGNMWKLANGINRTRRNTNTPIHGAAQLTTMQ
jgi:hypothetical protein